MTNAIGSSPSGAGGVITDGRYHLTSAKAYNPDQDMSGVQLNVTIEIQGGAWRRGFALGAGQNTYPGSDSGTFTTAPSPPVISGTVTCNDGATQYGFFGRLFGHVVPTEFTATAEELTILERPDTTAHGNKIIYTFSKE